MQQQQADFESLLVLAAVLAAAADADH